MDPRPDEPTAKLYRELAPWFHLLTAPDEYEQEADLYRRLIIEYCEGTPTEVLELGSGGGNNASHLKASFHLTLTDLSDDMLEISRSLNPECEHVQGDMRTLRLGREFDAVFIHDAVDYITSEDDLKATMETAFVHCRPGGVALFAPDHVAERFHPGTDHGGRDRGGRGLRYLEWTWDPDQSDSTYLVDFAYLLRDEDGTVRAEYDRHVCGLFSRTTWTSLLGEVGFGAQMRLAEHGEDVGSELFVGAKPV
jgi:SAM-dependent methyltransferase